MKKDTKDTICAIITLVAVFLCAYFIGNSSGYDRGLSEGYDRGLSEGILMQKGDKWDCAYSYSTGFIMCDRTPKYKG